MISRKKSEVPDPTDARIDKLRGDLLMVLRRNSEALSAYNRAMAFRSKFQ